MSRILVVDDEPQILRALRINLSVRGYEVVTASTGAGALRAAAERPPDVVVLDLGLPDMDGTEVLAGLRGWCTAPVIVLSARTDSADKVEALDAGADDYVTKLRDGRVSGPRARCGEAGNLRGGHFGTVGRDRVLHGGLGCENSESAR